MNVRAFAAHDLAAIDAIQLECPQAAHWREEDYLRLASSPGGMVLVAEIDGTDSPEVVGFAAFHRVMEEAELRNLAIQPAHQRKGFARALLEAGIHRMQKAAVRQLFLEVRASNGPALKLYASAGFRLLYTRRGYYHDPAEDALVLAREISPASPSQGIC